MDPDHLSQKPAFRMLFVLLLLTMVHVTGASEPRYLLTKNYQKDHLRKTLIPISEYHPFPRASERAEWESVLPSLREEYISRGNLALNGEWPPLPASLLLSFKLTGDRSGHGEPFSERSGRLADLVLAECMEGKGRFMEEIVDGIWVLCEESSWCSPVHLVIQRSGSGLPDTGMIAADPGLPDVASPIIDLGAGERANLMAWTWYLLGDQLDKVSPLLKQRIHHEIKRRIIDPLQERDDYWWMWTPGKEHADHHVNNWTPWICSNWLTAVLLVEQDQETRIDAVYRIMEVLDRYLNEIQWDGGCDEGPGYFNHAGGAAFDCLELLFDATCGAINIYDDPLVRNMGSYIYKAHIADNFYTNFADASAIINIHPFHLYRFGQRINDETLCGFAASKAFERDILDKGIGDNPGRQLHFLFNAEKIESQRPHVPLLRDVWLPGIQVMAAREKGGSIEGLYVAAKGGYNDESHNHNDAGHFIVYSNGRPAIIDVGVGRYTAQTFSASRYDIWTMQSAYHNLPLVNGFMQPHGKEFRAVVLGYSKTPGLSTLSLDLAAAYPDEAAVERWERDIQLDRQNQLISVRDDYRLTRVIGDLQFILMTPCDVSVENHQLHLTGGLDPEKPVDLIVQFDSKLKTEVEKITLTDSRLKRIWGDHLNRICLIDTHPGNKDEVALRIRQGNQ